MVRFKKAVVLGGSGLVGRAISETLSKTYNVIVVDKQNKLNHKNNQKIDIFSKKIHSYLLNAKPSLIVNAVNIATIITSHDHNNFDRLIRFYFDLYQTITQLPDNTTYIQVGTTGSGGLGIDIPFTHGERQSGSPILYKAAAAGAVSMLLVLMSRSLNESKKIIEVKPGLSIFDKNIKSKHEDNLSIVTLNGGESGQYTYNEVALLTTYMGFTTVQSISNKILATLGKQRLKSKYSSNNIIESINKSIIAETSRDRIQKRLILNRMLSLQHGNYLIASGNLGPPAITKQLIIGAALTQKNKWLRSSSKLNLWSVIESDPWLLNNLSYIKINKPKLHNYLKNELNKNLLYLKPKNTISKPFEYVVDMLNR